MIYFSPIDVDVTFEIDAVAAKKYSDTRATEMRAFMKVVNDPAPVAARFNAAQSARRAKLALNG